MRISMLAAALVAAVGVITITAASPVPATAGYSVWQKGNAQPAKPADARGGGDDSCQWANDHECDEPGVGTGACAHNTDRSDCVHVISGRDDDSCRWAHDGECDEPQFGTNACTQGTDRSDCGNVTDLRFRNDSCETAFNGVCDEPGQGTGRCRARTDRRDCIGARRPLNINDHFFGNDDRVFVDRTQAPWRSVGQLRTADGGVCTATLIGSNVLITAAHCIHTDGQVDAHGTFTTAQGLAGGPYTAQVTAYFIDPRFDYRRFTGSNDIDGLDYAILRIDQPLGDRVGFLPVFNLTALGQDRARQTDLFHAGYSWDTSGHLSAHLGCHIRTVYPDGTFAHECDTTRGDSGSPFMVRNGQTYSVIGVDSNFRSVPHGSALYIAVSAASFQRYVADFTAGRIGHPVGGGDKGKSGRN